MDDEHYWSRESSRSNRKLSNPRSSFRHEQSSERLHGEHERWSSGQQRERFPAEHNKRDRYEYQRCGSNYHRERDHVRLGDKRCSQTLKKTLKSSKCVRISGLWATRTIGGTPEELETRSHRWISGPCTTTTWGAPPSRQGRPSTRASSNLRENGGRTETIATIDDNLRNNRFYSSVNRPQTTHGRRWSDSCV